MKRRPKLSSKVMRGLGHVVSKLSVERDSGGEMYPEDATPRERGDIDAAVDYVTDLYHWRQERDRLADRPGSKS